MRRTALALLAAPFAVPFVAPPALAGGGCHVGGPAVQQRTSTIVIDHACFGTGAAVVAAGQPVTWRNPSGLEHNISGPGVEFSELPAGGTVTLTFARPGLYPYACTLHPGMSGVLVVGAVPSVAPAAVAPPAAPPVAPPAATPTDRGSEVPVGALAAGAAVALVAGVVLVSLRRRDPLPA